MNVFIDFDGSVFDFESFRFELFELFQKMGYENFDIESTYTNEFLNNKYSPIGHFHRLQDVKKSNEALAVARFDHLYKRSYRFIYPDVLPFLIEMKKKNHNVNLLTFGDVDFQKAKVKYSDLENKFNKIYYCDIPKSDFLQKILKSSEKYVLIDDKGKTIEDVTSRFNNVFALRVDRKEDEINNEFKNQLSVKSLSQAVKFLS